MWHFQGEYTGEAKRCIQQKQKKQAIGWGIFIFIVVVAIYAFMAVALGDGNATYITIILCGIPLTMVLFLLAFFLESSRAQKCDIKIVNDGIEIFVDGRWVSCAFYKIKSIEYHDEWIDLFPQAILQKDLLVEGDWDELKAVLEKIEASLATDDPIYQLEEPTTEFLQATVQSKRIFKQFVGEVQRPRAVFTYFVTFALEGGDVVEYAIKKETYETLEEGQVGTLVLVSGNFFAFGDGEEQE